MYGRYYFVEKYQVLKHNDGKVYFPIAKITVEVAKSNASSKGTRV